MPVGKGIPIKSPIGAKMAILAADFVSKGSAITEYIVGCSDTT